MGEPIESMVVDENYVWHGTPGSGLVRYDKQTGEHKRYLSAKDDSSTLSSDVILCLFVDPNTRQLWVGTDKGLDRYDAASDTFRRISGLKLRKRSTPSTATIRGFCGLPRSRA